METYVLGVGAEWLRWEPHVHTPGTMRNDQFGGDWGGWLKAIEDADPPIRALGVTDYNWFDGYLRVREEKEAGRLARCDLIFPNIELRMENKAEEAPVNLHLLVRPDDLDHIVQLEGFLDALTFEWDGMPYSGRPDSLVRLGRKIDPKLIDDRAARAHGSEQFKLSLDRLRNAFRANAWARENISVAVAARSGDGLSGLRGGFLAQRAELARLANIIFDSNPKTRDYWLGLGVDTTDQVISHWGSLKPCLHGSDAHRLDKVGRPDADRFCWVKGEPAFDALRHACAVPDRAYVGPVQPSGPNPSDVATRLTLRGAGTWAMTPDMPLNSGLVAVIGARGSGKTALLEAIAAACEAVEYDEDRQGFLERAQAEHLLDGVESQITWGAGAATSKPLDRPYADAAGRARYLSQKFVDQLCDAQGMKDALVAEIERVVFEAHPTTSRDGTIDFADLREMRAAPHRRAREQTAAHLIELCDQFNAEQVKRDLLPDLKRQAAESQAVVDRYKADRQRLLPSIKDTHAQRLADVMAAAEKAEAQVRIWTSRLDALDRLEREVASIKTRVAPQELERLKAAHTGAGFKGADWDPFLRSFDGDTDRQIQLKREEARRARARWVGTPPAPTAQPGVPYVALDADLTRTPLALLTAEAERLQQLVAFDAGRRRSYGELSRRIATESEKTAKLKERAEDYERAAGRMQALRPERETTYRQVFGALLAEEEILRDLYAPLAAKLEGSTGVLPQLAFEVERRVDVQGWASRGEELLDLRKGEDERKGRGWLLKVADPLLGEAWRAGDAAAIGNAMTTFRQQHDADLLRQALVHQSDKASWRGWLRDLARWLYGTNHVQLRYRLTYEGVDIRALSPGTRGIVTLLLYLALDDQDARPLLIDQPEENLDPRSIQQVLVPLFQAAKGRRQVIMVTHNANLVVNADADQVIVASCGARQGDGLPPIRYEGGSLDSRSVQEMVCAILEGGRAAFRERAKRLRL